MSRGIHAESVLLVTLDSCRFDTAERAPTPTLDSIGPRHRAMSPAHFTLASHAAMWVGTTPGIPGLGQPVLDPKYGRLFRLETTSVRATERDVFALEGATIIEGFRRAGYLTLGTAAVDWFDPATPAGARLSADFERFHFARGASARQQLAWVTEQLDATRPAFVFVNLGETHVPYWHEGAAWSRDTNPCVPYAGIRNDRSECERRQAACLTHVDGLLAPLVERFLDATILVTADHADAWGEDGLWEHGIAHPIVFTVPLWVRVRGVPCTRS